MSYNPFIKIFVEHEYSDYQLCPTLRLQPTKKTAYWLNQHKCIALYGPGSVKISKHEDYNVEKLSVLDFLGFCSDPNFMNYTLFENEQYESVPVYHCITPKSNNIKTDFLWEKWDSLFEVNQYVKPCFIIKLQILPNVLGEQKISIRLSSKKVYAKYYIMGEFTQSPTQIIDLSCSHNKITFNEVQEDLPVKAQAFISDRPIPLQKGCRSHFQLLEKDSSRVLLPKLPDVNPGSIIKTKALDGSSILIAEALVL